MDLLRRHFLVAGAAGLTMAGLGVGSASAAGVSKAIKELTGGASVAKGALHLRIPDFLEHGHSVQMSVTAPGAKTVTVFATKNPLPKVAEFKFGRLNPSRSITTRIRLAQSQHVIAIAEMEDGSFQESTRHVNLTIAGCDLI